MIPYVLLAIVLLILVISVRKKLIKIKFFKNLKPGDKVGVLCYGLDSETIFTVVIKKIERTDRGKLKYIEVEYSDDIINNKIFQNEKYVFPYTFGPSLIRKPIIR